MCNPKGTLIYRTTNITVAGKWGEQDNSDELLGSNTDPCANAMYNRDLDASPC